ncbi:predicted protein [Uncinocarpus reesii 1704]|uniref:Uncharacterized protein n=1 Tax=Uncinocarpus reesii (strain UAMH 1704) TaxID=336963 RepID=C4JT65_UNCRE|nr:uncharacterized protein UREG_05654 [Uncinocarpus reesii 1704]EEP80812.1 predicted protein [Uncinocarpus reesii 1704]
MLRLRKAFRYPESDNDDSSREELDEQEQETLIQSLRRQDEERNAQYKVGYDLNPGPARHRLILSQLVFTILPLVSSIIYFPRSLAPSNTPLQTAFCVLGIASLVATAYIMWAVTPTRPDRKGKRPIRDIERENGFLKRYLAQINFLACASLSVAACFVGDPSGSKDLLRVLYVVPGAVYLVVYIVRKTMMSVDIGELERLRYEFKGA